MQTLDRVIHKFVLGSPEETITAVDPTVLAVGFDPKIPFPVPVVWVEVSLDQNGQTPEGIEPTPVTLFKVSTGHIVPQEAVEYVGTVVYPNGLVDHVYRD